MNDPLSVGIIGAIPSACLRARALQRIRGMRLDAVADFDLHAAQNLADSFMGVRVAPSPEALALDPSIDAVIVNTSPVHHAALVLACLGAGKHVLVEPPLATSVAACERLVSAASEASVCLAVSYMLRFSPAARKARRLVDSGAIGEVDHVRAFQGHNGTEYFGRDWRVDARETGGGALMSGGGHMIDQARWFLGDICESTGYGTEHVWRQPACEDNGFLLLLSATGHVAQVHASWSEWRRYRYRVEVYGTRGYVRFGYSPLWLAYAKNGRGRRARVRHDFFPVFQAFERVKGWKWSLTAMFEASISDWRNAIFNRAEAATSGRDGLEVVRIAQSIERLPPSTGADTVRCR